MDPLTRIVAERACTALQHRYAELMDIGPAVKAIELFSDEPIIIRHNGQAFSGRDALRALFAAKDAGPRVTVHTISNISITVTDSSQATGLSIWTLYEAGRGMANPGEPMPLQGPAMIGRYRDSYVCIRGEWRFKKREITAEFKQT